VSSAALRKAVYGILVASAPLAALGYDEPNIFPIYAPDSPDSRRWMVLRWGAVSRGIGPANKEALTVWIYNREPDYDPIIAAIKEIKALLPTLVAQRFTDGSGAVLGADWQGDTDDSYDDAYRAYMRNTAWQLTASGN
jgi:hypothetical protein